MTPILQMREPRDSEDYPTSPKLTEPVLKSRQPSPRAYAGSHYHTVSHESNIAFGT